MTPDPGQTDFHGLIVRLRGVLRRHQAEERSGVAMDRQALVREWGLTRRGEGIPSVVVGDEVGVELGKPGTVSVAWVMTTAAEAAVHDGRVRCFGPDLGQPIARLGYAQIVLAAVDPDWPVNPLEFGSTLHLTNRLPGVMSRALPGRLWMRVARSNLRNGFELNTLGSALLAATKMDFPQLRGVEVVVATDARLLQELGAMAADVTLLAGKQRKRQLAADGVFDCAELDCEVCEERPECDELRDISRRYRRRFDGTG